MQHLSICLVTTQNCSSRVHPYCHLWSLVLSLHAIIFFLIFQISLRKWVPCVYFLTFKLYLKIFIVIKIQLHYFPPRAPSFLQTFPWPHSFTIFCLFLYYWYMIYLIYIHIYHIYIIYWYIHIYLFQHIYKNKYIYNLFQSI